MDLDDGVADARRDFELEERVAAVAAHLAVGEDQAGVLEAGGHGFGVGGQQRGRVALPVVVRAEAAVQVVLTQDLARVESSR